MPFNDLRDVFFSESEPDGIIISQWQERAKQDPFMEDVVMTVDLVFANGERLGIATENIKILDSNGDQFSYLPMLQNEIDIISQINFMSGAASQRTLTVSLDARTVKPLSIMKKFGSISGFAEISLQKQGDLYEKRYRLIVGDMVGGISFGADDEPMSVQISDPKLTNDKIIPEEICSPERIPTAKQSAMGQRYPLVLHDYPYVPTLMITHFVYGPRFLAAYGHVDVTGVYVSSEDAAGRKYGPTDTINGSPGYTVSYLRDELGSPFTQIDFNPTPDAWPESESCYAEVKSKLQNTDSNIISLIRELLEKQSYLGASFIDNNLFSLSRSKIPNASANLCINGSSENNTATVTSYIESNLCETFKMISMAYTGFGYGPVVTDRRYQNINYSLVRGQNIIIDRTTTLNETTKESIYNSFTFRYNYNPVSDNYESSIILDENNSSICAKSKELMGPRQHPTIDSQIVFDDSTANYIVHWLENHITLPSYTVTYIAIPAAFFILNVGDNVYLTDDKLEIQNEIATVMAISYIRGKCTVTLKLWYGYRGVA